MHPHPSESLRGTSHGLKLDDMKNCKAALGLCLALLCFSAWGQSQKMADILGDEFYPPELIGVGRQALGLTQDQEDAIQEASDVGRQQGQVFQRRLNVETRRLEGMVKAEKLDPDAIVKQASIVMDLERDTKMAHLVMLVKIKNTLTPEQQATLRKIKGQIPVFKPKLARAQELAEKRKDEGQDISAFAETRAQFEELMRNGRFKEAEALLDRTIQSLAGTNSMSSTQRRKEAETRKAQPKIEDGR